MIQIGEFAPTSDGYIGRIHTLSLAFGVRLVAAEPGDSENAPDYRVHLGHEDDGPEIGAGWKRSSERAGAFIAVVLDDPAFAQPIRANLFQSGREDGIRPLMWSRPSRQRGSD